MGLTTEKECEEMIMEGLAGERKRWPLLINQRETLPKSPIHNLTMEITTEQNLEWNMGGVTAETGQKKKILIYCGLYFCVSVS